MVKIYNFSVNWNKIWYWIYLRICDIMWKVINKVTWLDSQLFTYSSIRKTEGGDGSGCNKCWYCWLLCLWNCYWRKVRELHPFSFLWPPMCHVLIFQQKIESDQSSGWIGVCLQWVFSQFSYHFIFHKLFWIWQKICHQFMFI